MTYMEIIMATINIIVAVVVGGSQIYISKKVKDLEVKQDRRDEQRRTDQVYADATKFIQKYNQNGHESDIALLPFCVAAYKYNAIYPYRREIYRDFCSLTKDVQNEILKRCEIDILSDKYDDYFSDMLNRIIKTTETYYQNDAQGRYFYEGGKYLNRALTHHGTEKVPDDFQCELDEEAKQSLSFPIMSIGGLYKDGKMKFSEHVKNLLSYHKNEKPLTLLLEYFQANDEIIASYICCLIAKYSAIYNSIETDGERQLGYDCDYCGERYMEDLFLETLHIVEHYIT